jgi:hypothetical protein
MTASARIVFVLVGRLAAVAQRQVDSVGDPIGFHGEASSATACAIVMCDMPSVARLLKRLEPGEGSQNAVVCQAGIDAISK